VVSHGGLIVLGIVAVLAFAGIAYWQLVVAEGAYLGTRVVALLYDLFAPRYDQVKQYDKTTDVVMLAVPIMQHLARKSAASVLDVATGTGRLPDALLSQPRFTGRIVAIDASAKMLTLARVKLNHHIERGRIALQLQDAQSLPYDDASFDVITCLEALEFMGDWRAAVREMMRVLKPGGMLMISNRIGPDAWKLPGRAIKTDTFVAWLREINLTDAHAHTWLVDYDLIIGTKS
jgi:ubiquinone/menaquinone biosynthesis C-methylase UbiE